MSSRRTPEEAKRIMELIDSDPGQLPEDVKALARKWGEYIKHYLMYRRSRGYSEIQTLNQAYFLRRIAKFFTAYGIGPEEVSFNDVIALLSHDRVRNKPLTILWKYQNVLKQFYRVLVKSGFVKENPFEDLKLKVEKPVKRALTLEQLQKLLDEAYKLNVDMADALKFLAYTGLRIQEFKMLKSADIDLENRVMRVYNVKTDRVEFVPMLREAFEIASKRRIEDVNRFTKKTLNIFIKRAAKNAGIDFWREVSLHTLRHTFVTMILNLTRDPHLTKYLARHVNLQTTSQYLYLSLEEAKRKLMEHRL